MHYVSEIIAIVTIFSEKEKIHIFSINAPFRTIV